MGEAGEGGLLYFRGVCGGMVKVACTLLYSIFRVGRGLLYFRGCFWGEVLDEKNPFLDGGRNGFLYCFWSDGVGVVAGNSGLTRPRCYSGSRQT